MSSPTTFPRFASLPPEIRQSIWGHFALPAQPLLHVIAANYRNEYSHSFCITSFDPIDPKIIPTLRNLMQTTRESRRAVLGTRTLIGCQELEYNGASGSIVCYGLLRAGGREHREAPKLKYRFFFVNWQMDCFYYRPSGAEFVTDFVPTQFLRRVRNLAIDALNYDCNNSPVSRTVNPYQIPRKVGLLPSLHDPTYPLRLENEGASPGHMIQDVLRLRKKISASMATLSHLTLVVSWDEFLLSHRTRERQRRRPKHFGGYSAFLRGLAFKSDYVSSVEHMTRDQYGFHPIDTETASIGVGNMVQAPYGCKTAAEGRLKPGSEMLPNWIDNSIQSTKQDLQQVLGKSVNVTMAIDHLGYHERALGGYFRLSYPIPEIDLRSPNALLEWHYEGHIWS